MNDSIASLTTREEMQEKAAAHGAKQPRLMHVFPSFAVGGVPNRIAAIINRLGNAYFNIDLIEAKFYRLRKLFYKKSSRQRNASHLGYRYMDIEGKSCRVYN